MSPVFHNTTMNLLTKERSFLGILQEAMYVIREIDLASYLKHSTFTNG